MRGGIGNSQPLGVVFLNISHDPVQQFRLFPAHRDGGLVVQRPHQLADQQHGVAHHRRLPAQTLFFCFLHAPSEQILQAFPPGAGSTQQIAVHLLFGALPLQDFIEALGTNALGYSVTAIVAVALGCGLVFIHYFFTVERNAAAQVAVKSEEEKEAEKIKVTDILNVFRVNRPYLALCIHSICICFVQGVAQGAAQYMYIDILGDIGLQSFASVISMPVMFGGLIVAPILAKKFDLVAIIRTCILVGCILLGTCFIYAVTVPVMNPWIYMIWSGIGTGLVTLSVQLQWGLVGESIDYNEYLTGKRSEGSIYGTFSLTRRIGQTLSASLAVLMITWFGYVSHDPEVPMVQPDSAVMGIKLMCILIPGIIGMGSWLAFRFIWDITPEKRAKMAAWKAERAAKAAAEQIAE